MAELASARVKEGINSLLEELDRSCMRKMQGDMHRCAAKCCDNPSLSMEESHTCIESCSKTITEAQAYLQNELTNYQDRLQRCVMQCQDNIRDKVTPSTTEAQVSSFKKDFESCVVKCADAHIDLIPSMTKRMKEVLLSKAKST
ncbi:protein FAM136A [Trichonephila clavipes]|uniref:Protein FAM136A n=2 Tax=Trichonephila TaxID=2585208 RepID=A0A8X6GJU2_TRICU|nr:protein FAM136A [Trichonephila clavata]GFS43400.1 protein FAM136A [Trichonephila inaurata madagascariensis]GFW32475.1 protein FAM136A [Trichonephila clavipes]